MLFGWDKYLSSMTKSPIKNMVGKPCCLRIKKARLINA